MTNSQSSRAAQSADASSPESILDQSADHTAPRRSNAGAAVRSHAKPAKAFTRTRVASIAAAAFSVVIPALSSSVHAQTWDGGGGTDGSWGAAINWTTDTLPSFSNTTDLVFAAPSFTGPTMRLGVNRTVRSLTFNSNLTSNVAVGYTDGSTARTFTIGGAGGAAITVDSGATGNITLGNNGTGSNGALTLAEDLAISHNGSGTLLFNRSIGGAFGVTKTGSGVMQTSDTNGFTGALTVNGGRWVVSSATAGGDLNNASAINLGGGTLEIQTAATSKTFTKQINVTNASTLVYNSTDTVTTRTLTLDGTASGSINLSTAGTNLTISNISTSSSLVSGINISRIITGPGKLTISTNTVLNSIADGATIRRAFLSASNNFSGGLVIAKGTASIGAAAGTNPAGTGAIDIGVTGDSNGAALSFNQGSGVSVTLNNSIFVRSGGFRLIRNNGVFDTNITLSGPVTLENDLTVGHGGLNSDRFITLSGVISGTTGNLNINGTGSVAGSRVRLTGGTSSTYTGNTIVSNTGQLQISNDFNLGDPLSVPTTGRLVLNDGTLTTAGAISLNANRGVAIGPTSGTGAGNFNPTASTLTVNGIVANNGGGTGQLVKTGAGTLLLSGSNTYTGTTTVNFGTLAIAGTQTGGGQLIVNNASVLQFGGGTSTAGSSDSSGTIFVNNTGWVQVNKTDGGTVTNAVASNPGTTTTLSGANAAGTTNTFTATSFNNGGGFAVNSTNAGAVLAFSGSAGAIDLKGTNITLNGAGDILFTSAGQGLYSSTTASNVTKAGTGTLIYQGNQGYTGTTAIDAGTVRVDAAQGNSGTYFVGNGTTTVTAASLLLGGGAAGLTGGVTFNRGVSINPGDGTNRTIGGSNTSGSNTFSAAIALDGVSPENRSANLTAAAGGTVIFSNVISGAGQNITKVGNGQVVLSAANTYSGSTNINAGVLQVNNTTGSGTGSGAVNVSGGTLAGTGTASGAVTLSSGGTVSPGAGGVGSLTLGSGLTGTGVFTLEITATASPNAGVTHDLLRFTATSPTVTLSGVTLNILPLGAASGYTFPTTYRIVSSTNSFAASLVQFANTSGGVFNDGPISGNVTLGTNFVDITITSVPEPGAIGLLAVGSTMLLRRRRRASGLASR